MRVSLARPAVNRPPPTQVSMGDLKREARLLNQQVQGRDPRLAKQGFAVISRRNDLAAPQLALQGVPIEKALAFRTPLSIRTGTLTAVVSAQVADAIKRGDVTLAQVVKNLPALAIDRPR